ncbi:MAG: dual specificity protein phosphatase family protein [Ktedonobacteraceae bacterium]|nr:dual specificity protein phosphatase family protein [Ktedonobacteraceae bacterium]
MSPEQVPPPPTEEQDSSTTLPTTPENSSEVPPTTERPHVHFSYAGWASSGVIRVLYRSWTRVAAHLFPENSPGERIAQKLHIPLPDKLNMSWVNDHLAVGGRVRPEDIRALALSGVTHVVDTRSEYCDDKDALAQEHIDLLYLPTPDTYPLSVEQLMQGAAWTDEQIRKGGRVLIHCEHGVGRSVLLTSAVLVYEGMNARDALELVKKKRWQASPNQRQVDRLREFEAALPSSSRPSA